MFLEAASAHWLPMSSGIAFGLALMISLGPQNMFLIRQGLSRSHVWTTATTGCLSDFALVLGSFAGFGATMTTNPSLVAPLTWLGALFLVLCGLCAILGAIFGSQASSLGSQPTRARAALCMLTVTWANPLYYIEVLLPFGFLSARFTEPTSSRQFARFFERPTVRRVLDIGASVVLLSLGLSVTTIMLRQSNIHLRM